MISEGDRKQGDDGTIYEYRSGAWVAVGHEDVTDLPLDTVTITHRRQWWILAALAGVVYWANKRGQ